jgi:hypothetical protein
MIWNSLEVNETQTAAHADGTKKEKEKPSHINWSILEDSWPE